MSRPTDYKPSAGVGWRYFPVDLLRRFGQDGGDGPRRSLKKGNALPPPRRRALVRRNGFAAARAR
mgnify:CR=1 FL=1